LINDAWCDSKKAFVSGAIQALKRASLAFLITKVALPIVFVSHMPTQSGKYKFVTDKRGVGLFIQAIYRMGGVWGGGGG